MSVVFDLADRISVLVYGEVIATDVPARIRAQRGRAGGLPRRRRREPRRMLEVRRPARLLRQEPHPAGRRLPRRRGRDRQPARPQRRRPLDGDQGDHGSRRARGLGASSRASGSAGSSRTRSRAAGLGYVPEDRAIFPRLTVRENLILGMKPARSAKARWSKDDMFALFPLLRERADAPGGVLSGGEQQMLTICRTLMGDPDLIMIDEPTEGLRADDGRARARVARADRRARRRDPAHRAEADDRARASRSGCT